MITSADTLFFWVVRRGVKGQKMTQNDKKNCLTSYLRNCTTNDCGFWYRCVKWWYLRQFFFISSKFVFFEFSKFISKRQKEILRCAPPSSHVCDFFFLGIISRKGASYILIGREEGCFLVKGASFLSDGGISFDGRVLQKILKWEGTHPPLALPPPVLSTRDYVLT